MRRGFAAVLAAILLPGISSSEEESEIDAPAQRAGYSLGHQIGGDLKRQSAEIDAAALLRGLRDGLQGADPSLPPEEMNAILVELKRRIQASQRKGSRPDAERHREEGR
jgi:FKBP-type peptidyl-prolyl cis-trans isomerase FklB